MAGHTVAFWALAWYLGSLGLIPKQIPADWYRPYLNGQQMLRIGLGQGERVSLSPGSSGWLVSADRRRVRLSPGREINLRMAGSSALLETTVDQPQELSLPLEVTLDQRAASRIRIDGQSLGEFPGSFELMGSPLGLAVVNLAPLERYLAGVAAAEMPARFPMEALKSQAIVARSYALYQLGRHRAEGFDLCSQVHCQVYRGEPPPARVTAAVRATAGQVLTYRGSLVYALFHSDCGGATESIWNAWPGRVFPYLTGGPDPYCRRRPWQASYSRQEAAQLVRRNLPILLGQPALDPGQLEDLRPAGRTPAGRIGGLEVVTDRGHWVIQGDDARWLFGQGRPGPGGLRSTRLSLETGGQEFVFQGRGWGHGLGLCQWGARGRALAGENARQMLAAYYPGTRVTTIQ